MSVKEIVRMVDGGEIVYIIADEPYYGGAKFANIFSSQFPGIRFVEVQNMYVPKELRRKGIGTQLIYKVIEENKDCAIFVSGGSSDSVIQYPEGHFGLYDRKCAIDRFKDFFIKSGFMQLTTFGNIFKNLSGEECELSAYMYKGNTMGRILFDHLFVKRMIKFSATASRIPDEFVM